MKESEKEIDISIEILNEEFFNRLKSCQILHLRPKFYNLESNEHLSIENKSFGEVKINEKYLP